MVDINIDTAKLNEDNIADSITPILGRIHSVQSNASEGTRILLDTSVFIIGFYVGKGAPDDIGGFLCKLIRELCRLSPLNADVSCTGGREFTASIRCIIADSPMRCYLKRTKFYTGYYACDRCIQKGERINGAILYPRVDAPLRIDEDFLSYHVNDFSVDEHITNPMDQSPFVDINFAMVTGFVIDPMHTMIDGALGRRISGFVSEPYEGKLDQDRMDEVNMRLKYCRSCRQYGFDRYVETLDNFKHFKTHVKRHFMYYYLFPVFEGILDDDELQHLMLLPYAMMLMGSYNRGPVCPTRILEAEKALKRYSIELTEYGIPCRFVSHQVIHIPQDVAQFQCGVETLSAFPFESFQKIFRKCLRSGNLQAEQIRNRLIEKAKYQLPTTDCGTIIENKVQLMIESKKRNSKLKGLLKFVDRGERWPKKLVFT